MTADPHSGSADPTTHERDPMHPDRPAEHRAPDHATVEGREEPPAVGTDQGVRERTPAAEGDGPASAVTDQAVRGHLPEGAHATSGRAGAAGPGRGSRARAGKAGPAAQGRVQGADADRVAHMRARAEGPLRLGPGAPAPAGMVRLSHPDSSGLALPVWPDGVTPSLLEEHQVAPMPVERAGETRRVLAAVLKCCWPDLSIDPWPGEPAPLERVLDTYRALIGRTDDLMRNWAIGALRRLHDSAWVVLADGIVSLGPRCALWPVESHGVLKDLVRRIPEPERPAEPIVPDASLVAAALTTPAMPGSGPSGAAGTTADADASKTAGTPSSGAHEDVAPEALPGKGARSVAMTDATRAGRVKVTAVIADDAGTVSDGSVEAATTLDRGAGAPAVVAGDAATRAGVDDGAETAAVIEAGASPTSGDRDSRATAVSGGDMEAAAVMDGGTEAAAVIGGDTEAAGAIGGDTEATGVIHSDTEATGVIDRGPGATSDVDGVGTSPEDSDPAATPAVSGPHGAADPGVSAGATNLGRGKPDASRNVGPDGAVSPVAPLAGSRVEPGVVEFDDLLSGYDERRRAELVAAFMAVEYAAEPVLEARFAALRDPALRRTLAEMLERRGRTLIQQRERWTSGHADDLVRDHAPAGALGESERAVLTLVLVHSVAIPRAEGLLPEDSWLSPHPTPVEELRRHTQIPIGELESALRTLRHAGLLTQVKAGEEAGGYVPGPQFHRLTPAARRRLQEELILAAGPDTPLAAAVRARRSAR
jgi:hypothetical protein